MTSNLEVGSIDQMSKDQRYSGPGFFTLLAVSFITLKLSGILNWSWLWILSPIWVPITILLCSLGVAWVVLTFRQKPPLKSPLLGIPQRTAVAQPLRTVARPIQKDMTVERRDLESKQRRKELAKRPSHDVNQCRR